MSGATTTRRLRLARRSCRARLANRGPSPRSGARSLAMHARRWRAPQDLGTEERIARAARAVGSGQPCSSNQIGGPTAAGRHRCPIETVARPTMRQVRLCALSFVRRSFSGGGDDDSLAGTAEAESHGRGPRLVCWHPIVPPSSAVVAAVGPARAPGGSGRRACVGACAWPATGGGCLPGADRSAALGSFG